MITCFHRDFNFFFGTFITVPITGILVPCVSPCFDQELHRAGKCVCLAHPYSPSSVPCTSHRYLFVNIFFVFLDRVVMLSSDMSSALVKTLSIIISVQMPWHPWMIILILRYLQHLSFISKPQLWKCYFKYLLTKQAVS